MDRVVVFRFHRNPAVCRSRLELFRTLNPDVPVYGLGEPIGIDDALEHRHTVDGGDGDWAWQHGDLALADWYREVGRDLSFDVVHVVEWDLLLCAPLEDLYAHVPADGVALSGLRSMAAARDDGWSWVTDEGTYEHADDYDRLRELAREELGYDGEGCSCVFPGVALPRSFLAEYADLDVPAVANDEVRVPLVARALGYDCYDTGFHEWTYEGRRYFNGRGDAVQRRRIVEELEDPDGRRAFHPVRQSMRDPVLDRVA
jgi:hypothetical protein